MQNVSVEQGQQDAQQSAAELRAQIRQQVREQVQAAREQAQAAREQALQQAQAAREAARAAREAARAQGDVPQPGILVPPMDMQDMIPPQVVDISVAFFIMIAVIVVGLPLARAFARRLDRKAVPPAVDPGLASQLQRIENTVDSMAIEIERISEAQRYMARLQTERAEPAASLPPRQTTP